MAGEHTLYLVATPIGHRDDISLRALEVLRGVRRIYAEDTRHSAPLLAHHGIRTPLAPLHEHNEAAAASGIARRVSEEGDAALISDAGTPLISDPGYRLVRECIAAGVRVSPVPGACALTAALSVAGLPTDRFEFAGFPPARASARREWLAPLAARAHTLVLYESPHRIVDSLADIVATFGESRPLALARELTKRFETVLHGTAVELHRRVLADADQRRGEFVIVIGGAERASTVDDIALDRVLRTLTPHLPPKSAARIAAELCGTDKRRAYERLLALKASDAAAKN